MGQRICSVESCQTAHYAKGYCNRHWNRWRRYGDPEHPAQPLGPVAKPRLTITEKRCTTCGFLCPRDDFSKKSAARDGLNSWCRSCAAAKHVDYYAKNRDAALARVARWQRDHPEKMRALSDRAYAKNAEIYKARAKRWRSENPNRVAAREAQRRQWLRPVGIVDLETLWTGTCGICSQPLDRDVKWPDPESKSIDHIFPLSKGGLHEQANLQWAHLVCNLKKSDSVLSEE